MLNQASDIWALLIARCKATVGKTLQLNGHRVWRSKTAGMEQNRDALLCNCNCICDPGPQNQSYKYIFAI